MMNLLAKPFIAKVKFAAIIVLLVAVACLFLDNRLTKSQLAIAQNEVVQQQQANATLNAQLEKTNQQITNYLVQTKELQQKVLNQLQNKREKTDEILQILEQNKNWSSQPVPGSVSRLFKSNNVQGGRTNSATLPHRKSVPNTKPND